jgi:hypothetical protein
MIAVATAVVAAPGAIAWAAPTALGAYAATYAATNNLATWGWMALEGAGIPVTAWYANSAMRMGAPGLLTVGFRFGNWAIQECRNYGHC